ncbi:MAG: acyl-CoA thioesterase [Acidiferrobacterales bacterium]
MNLIFRLIRVLVTAFFRDRLSLLDESTLEFRVWPTDLDVNFHMNNARYLSMMDLGRLDLLVRAGLFATLMKQRWQPVVGSATIRYRRSLKPFQKYRLCSRIVGWDHKWFYLEQRFEVGDTLVASAVVKGLLRGSERYVPTAELLDSAGHDPESLPEPAAFVAALRRVGKEPG